MQFKSVVASALFAAVACAQNTSITDLLKSQPELSNLTTFITEFPDLVTALSSATNITVLAPTNDAFSKLLSSLGGKAPPSDVIKALLTYHVLNGSYTSSQISETPAFIPTLLTNTSYTNVTGGQVVELVKSGGTAEVFSGLLMNSTISGPVDVKFNGGYVHVIDTVLTIPALVSATAAAANLTAAAGALVSANLVSAVDTTPDITAFIPNNDAFAAIGSALPNLTTDQLADILKYHVVAGVVGYSSSLSNTTLTTLEGKNVTITVVDGSVFVNSAKVVVPNVLVANGVVHVIDNVLNPNNTSATPNPSASTQSPAFSGASSSSNIPFTTAAPTATATAGSGGSGATSSAATSSLSQAGAAGPFMPMKTGAIGAAALFGAGVVMGL